MLLPDVRDVDPPIVPGLSAEVPPIEVEPNIPVVPVPLDPIFVFENCPQALGELAAIRTIAAAIVKLKRMGRLQHCYDVSYDVSSASFDDPARKVNG